MSASASYVRKTANYTALSGDYLIADTAGGVFTITLPTSPTAGNFVSIIDGASWANNNLTIDRNGSTIEGVADNITVDIAGVKLELIYDGTTWEVVVSGGSTAQARGGPGDQIVFENGTTVSAEYTITTGMNGMSAGPITILSTGSITVPAGSTWTIV